MNENELNYYGSSVSILEDVSSSFEHYGVKGMKWGERKEYEPVGRRPGARMKKAARTAGRQMKSAGRTVNRARKRVMKATAPTAKKVGNALAAPVKAVGKEASTAYNYAKANAKENHELKRQNSQNIAKAKANAKAKAVDMKITGRAGNKLASEKQRSDARDKSYADKIGLKDKAKEQTVMAKVENKNAAAKAKQEAKSKQYSDKLETKSRIYDQEKQQDHDRKQEIKNYELKAKLDIKKAKLAAKIQTIDDKQRQDAEMRIRNRLAKQARKERRIEDVENAFKAIPGALSRTAKYALESHAENSRQNRINKAQAAEVKARAKSIAERDAIAIKAQKAQAKSIAKQDAIALKAQKDQAKLEKQKLQAEALRKKAEAESIIRDMKMKEASSREISKLNKAGLKEQKRVAKAELAEQKRAAMEEEKQQRKMDKADQAAMEREQNMELALKTLGIIGGGVMLMKHMQNVSRYNPGPQDPSKKADKPTDETTVANTPKKNNNTPVPKNQEKTLNDIIAERNNRQLEGIKNTPQLTTTATIPATKNGKTLEQYLAGKDPEQLARMKGRLGSQLKNTNIGKQVNKQVRSNKIEDVKQRSKSFVSRLISPQRNLDRVNYLTASTKAFLGNTIEEGYKYAAAGRLAGGVAADYAHSASGKAKNVIRRTAQAVKAKAANANARFDNGMSAAENAYGRLAERTINSYDNTVNRAKKGIISGLISSMIMGNVAKDKYNSVRDNVSNAANNAMYRGQQGLGQAAENIIGRYDKLSNAIGTRYQNAWDNVSRQTINEGMAGVYPYWESQNQRNDKFTARNNARMRRQNLKELRRRKFRSRLFQSDETTMEYHSAVEVLNSEFEHYGVPGMKWGKHTAEKKPYEYAKGDLNKVKTLDQAVRIAAYTKDLKTDAKTLYPDKKVGKNFKSLQATANDIYKQNRILKETGDYRGFSENYKNQYSKLKKYIKDHPNDFNEEDYKVVKKLAREVRIKKDLSTFAASAPGAAGAAALVMSTGLPLVFYPIISPSKYNPNHPRGAQHYNNKLAEYDRSKLKDKVKHSDTAEEYYSYMDALMDTFEHYGVKGMKWGVRRAQRSAARVYRRRHRMSNDELRDAMNRIDLENKLKNMRTEERRRMLTTFNKYAGDVSSTLKTMNEIGKGIYGDEWNPVKAETNAAIKATPAYQKSMEVLLKYRPKIITPDQTLKNQKLQESYARMANYKKVQPPKPKDPKDDDED